MANLKAGSKSAEPAELVGKRWQDRIDRGEYGATISAAEEKLGDRGQDQHGGFGPDGVQRGIKAGHQGAVDDLGGLHNLPRGHVQSGHVTTNICITNNGVHLLKSTLLPLGKMLIDKNGGTNKWRGRTEIYEMEKSDEGINLTAKFRLRKYVE